MLATEQVAAWGWRIPFIGSVVFCIAGWFLRRGIHETEEGLKAAAVRAPLVPSLLADWLPIRADVRHRRDDERRLLPDVHVRRRAAKEPDR